MNLFTHSYFFATLIASIVLSNADRGGTPHHRLFEDTVPQESLLKYGSNNLPVNVQEDFNEQKLEDEADELVPERDAPLWYKWNPVFRWEHKSKTEDTLPTVKMEALEEKNTPDKSEDLELSTQSFEVNRAKIVPKQDGRGLGGHLHRRSDSEAAKSTQADITQLFEGSAKPSSGVSVDLKRTEKLLLSSPAQLSSTRNTTFDEKGQSGADITHSVEGGGVPFDDRTQLISVNITQITSTTSLPMNITTVNVLNDHNLEGPDKLPTSITNNDPKLHKTVPRKGADAGIVVGRKGVGDINITGNFTNLNDSLPALSSANNHTNLEVTASHLNSSSSKTSSLPSLSADGKPIIIESNPPLKKKPNPKPLTLTDKSSFNTTPLPQEHVSSKRDYVVPVVILILTVPLVTILGIFLYKKGSEYWSRRHYRRMDFLIDGMYHD